MSDPNEVSAEGGSIGIECMRLWALERLYLLLNRLLHLLLNRWLHLLLDGQ